MGQKKRDRTKQLFYAVRTRMAIEKIREDILARRFDKLVQSGIIRRAEDSDLRIQV